MRLLHHRFVIVGRRQPMRHLIVYLYDRDLEHEMHWVCDWESSKVWHETVWTRCLPLVVLNQLAVDCISELTFWKRFPLVPLRIAFKRLLVTSNYFQSSCLTAHCVPMLDLRLAIAESAVKWFICDHHPHKSIPIFKTNLTRRRKYASKPSAP